MGITRDVVQDLLPLYLADEVSADTRTLVEEYLKNDAEFAKMVEGLTKPELPGEIPIPLAKEDAMEAYKEARRLMFLRQVVVAVVIGATVSCVLSMGFLAAVWATALPYFS